MSDGTRIETYDPDDAFHWLMKERNSKLGKGAVVAIVWDERVKFKARAGMVIRQTQYGLDAKAFSVDAPEKGKFHLSFLNSKVVRSSDYFDGVTQ